MVDNYLTVDQTNTIVSVFGWDGVAPFTPPASTQLFKFNGPSGVGWHWDGTTATDPNAPLPPTAPTVPQRVSPRQARLALVQAGLYAQVQQTIAAAPVATQVWWEFASVIERQNPLMLGIAAQLGLTAAQIDALFTSASTL